MIPESEYAFDKVPKEEVSDCLDWEFWRESIRRGYQGRNIHRPLRRRLRAQVPPPWLELSAEEKADFRLQGVGKFSESRSVLLTTELPIAIPHPQRHLQPGCVAIRVADGLHAF